MMKNSKLYFLFVLVLLIHTPAYAHPPYLMKQGVITDPDGNTVIKEKLYGDGVITAVDPATFQLRNRHGALLANSPIDDRVASFCPSINFCWAFPYSAMSLFSIGWSLNTEAVEFDKPAPNYAFKSEAEEEKFKSYLNDENVKHFSAYFLGYPEFNRSHSGFKQSRVSFLFGPFIIIADQFIPLLVILLLTLVLFILFWVFFKWKKIERKTVKYLVYTIGALLIAVYLFCYAIAMFVMAIGFPAPWLYILAFTIAGKFAATIFLKRNKIPKDRKA